MVWRTVSIVLALVCASTGARSQPANAPRIGFISGLTPEVMNSRVQAFKQGLRERGYVEGKDIVVEYRWGQNRPETRAELVKELVSLKPRVVVTAGPGLTQMLRDARVPFPVVMAFDPDPVGSGFVASLARPGGNITGLSNLAPDVSGKQIDVLRQIVPGLARIGVVWDSKEPGNEPARREIERAARLIGATVGAIDQQQFRKVEDAFEGVEGRFDALIVLSNARVVAGRKALTELAVKKRVPVMWPHADLVVDGGLVTYSANVEDLFRRAATYVDKILKGTKPSELPVEQPYKFDLVINLKAAQAIGVRIPLDVLSRADRVIQ